MSNSNPPALRARAPRWFRWLGALALAGYALFLARNTAVVAGGSDSSGYLNSARLLAAGKLLMEARVPAEFGRRTAVDAMHFIPQGFFPFTDPTRLVPTYPTGVPLHFAVAGKLLGWRAGPLLVMLLAAVGAVWLCYLLARELGMSSGLAAVGSITLATFPVFIFTSIQPLSDTLATTWTSAALFSAVRAGRGNSPWSAAGAGAALAMAVLVRPTNLVLAPTLVVLLGFDRKRFALFVAAGLPGAAWMASYNYRLYGGAFESGYGDVFAAFALSYGAATALHFAKWLTLLLPAALPVLAIAAWMRRDSRTRELIALTLAFAGIAGLYAFYQVSHEVWWCLRFILPAVPALILTGLLGVESVVRHSEKARCAAPFILVIWAVANASYWTPRLNVLMMKHYERAYAGGSLAARDQFPSNALVLSCAFSGSLYFYTDFPVMRWDQIDAPTFARYVGLTRKTGRPICAIIFDWEEKDAFRRCPGEWTRLATTRNVGLWRLAEPKN